MSKKSRALRKARTELAANAARTGDAAERPVATMRGPSDIVSGVPYIVGFEPTESIVVASVTGPRQRLGPCLRADLVRPSDLPALLDHILRIVVGHDWPNIIALAYTRDRALADITMTELLDRLDGLDIHPVEALGVGNGHWWSYTCDNPACCPSEGTPYEAAASSTVTAMVAAGMGKLPSRDDLRAVVAPDGEARRNSVATLSRLLEGTLPEPPGGSADNPVVRTVLTMAVDRDDLTLPELAELLTLVQDDGHRDAAWFAITRASAASHFELWRHVMCAAPDHLLAPAGALCAFAAWLDGRGVIAAHACERVLSVSPGYPLAVVVQEALWAGIDPREYERIFARDDARGVRGFVS